MRIALVTHYYPAHRGGIEGVAAELARRLSASAEIVWMASDCDAVPEIPGVRCEPSASWNGIERRLGFPYPLWSPAALARLAREVRAADVLHLHDCLYLPNVVASVAARRAGKPVVVTQHVGLVPYRNPLLRWLLAAANRLLGRLVLGGAAQVVFVGEAVRRYFEGFIRFRKPPLRVANGVDTAVFVPAAEARRSELRAALGVGPGAPLLLFAGRFVEKKGLPLLRALARALPEAKWIFAGWGPLDPGGWGLANVQVLRDRSSAALAPLYQAADLLVLPSVGEGFPLVVQEAMACGTPALVSAETAAGCPEAAGLLYAEPLGAADDGTRWERRLRELVLAGDALRARREPVAAFARTNWSWERCTQRYAEVLAACSR